MAWCTVQADRPHLTMALISGFLFVAPVLATVFYCLSHRLEHHHKLAQTFRSPAVMARQSGLAGSVHRDAGVRAHLWERISAILVALFLSGSGIGGLSDLLSLSVCSSTPISFSPTWRSAPCWR
jgi:uncharacterized membrane protein